MEMSANVAQLFETATMDPSAEIWHACAGSPAKLPPVGTGVVYCVQGHIEQVDTKTDEPFAAMTLQPSSFNMEDVWASDRALIDLAKPQKNVLCKPLTASDTNTNYGKLSVPVRAAEKILPFEFSPQHPVQQLVAKDFHNNIWPFSHKCDVLVSFGQPVEKNRHFLTTGWSRFLKEKKLFTGDSVLFIRDAQQQLLLGIRRAKKQPTNMLSSVLPSDSTTYCEVLKAAAQAAENQSPFTVFYYPRISPSEFVIPLVKYYNALCSDHIAVGMRFQMIFETEESDKPRGTITGISEGYNYWHKLQVVWDESTGGGRPNSVSAWEIEPVASPFPKYPKKRKADVPSEMHGIRHDLPLHDLSGNVRENLREAQIGVPPRLSTIPDVPSEVHGGIRLDVSFNDLSGNVGQNLPEAQIGVPPRLSTIPDVPSEVHGGIRLDVSFNDLSGNVGQNLPEAQIGVPPRLSTIPDVPSEVHGGILLDVLSPICDDQFETFFADLGDIIPEGDLGTPYYPSTISDVRPDAELNNDDFIKNVGEYPPEGQIGLQALGKDFTISGRTASFYTDEGSSGAVPPQTYIKVGNYLIKEEFSIILQDIINRYGDIGAKSHIKATNMRFQILEDICKVIASMKKKTLNTLSHEDLSEWKVGVEDAQVGVMAPWLIERINQLSSHMADKDLNAAIEKKSALKLEIVDAKAKKKDLEVKLKELKAKLEAAMVDLAFLEGDLASYEVQCQDFEEQKKKRDIMGKYYLVCKEGEDVFKQPLTHGLI
ncbi:hypothetical protein HHK36_017970 [Tetracentron sinense]|uniref:Auxin response factor n=1 Tax=Tetracentron sinense TaxID=13715 RepID=A0A834Z1F7_TETSI|nr:hypothetical protein HHK36_017970 [Tetracentron sinense]